MDGVTRAEQLCSNNHFSKTSYILNRINQYENTESKP